MRVAIVLLTGLLLVVLPACQGKVVPLSAQRGSTIVIPLRGADTAQGAPRIGYGGLEYDDYQRGTLEYRLSTPSGPFPLITRGTTSIAAHPGTQVARGGPISVQVVSLVDLPADTPLGTYDVDVVRNYTDPATGLPATPQNIDYNGRISVLPASIEVDLPGGGTETIDGSPNLFERWRCIGQACNWISVESDIPSVIPQPELRLLINQGAWAVDLELTYPETVMTVIDAWEPPLLRSNDLALVWFFDDPENGVLRIHAMGTAASLSFVSVVFDLVDGEAEILDPASDVSVSVVGAWDQNGAPVTRSASVFGIF